MARPSVARSDCDQLLQYPVASFPFSAIGRDMSAFSLHDLEAIIRQRAAASPDVSYTAKLLQGGVERAAKKFGEEAVEAVIAAISAKPGELTKEAADVLYHLLVVLRGADIPLSAVMAELESRTRQTGLQEKASRQL
jgi:phosphoribosyl-ATP pyrophosphohydrolase